MWGRSCCVPDRGGRPVDPRAPQQFPPCRPATAHEDPGGRHGEEQRRDQDTRDAESGGVQLTVDDQEEQEHRREADEPGPEPLPPQCAVVVDGDARVQELHLPAGLRQSQHGRGPRAHPGQPAAPEGVRVQLPRARGALRPVRQPPEEEERGTGAAQVRVQAGVAVPVLLGDVRELRELPQRRPRNLRGVCVRAGGGEDAAVPDEKTAPSSRSSSSAARSSLPR